MVSPKRRPRISVAMNRMIARLTRGAHVMAASRRSPLTTAPKKCHTVLSLLRAKLLITNKSRAKEVSHFFELSDAARAKSVSPGAFCIRIGNRRQCLFARVFLPAVRTLA
jgi:hypothetical protein